MAKQQNLELEARTYSPFSQWSFYRPHARVSEDNTSVDPVTGEIRPGPLMTKQEFKDQCDINNIIKSYKLTGQIAHMAANAAQGMYADLPEPLDFQEAQNILKQATDSFASLPSQIRDRFENSPHLFLTFLNDPNNRDEAIKLGLIAKPAPESEPPPPEG
jgi:phage internal scaffolding protein